jgi:hypothetical protein
MHMQGNKHQQQIAYTYLINKHLYEQTLTTVGEFVRRIHDIHVFQSPDSRLLSRLQPSFQATNQHNINSRYYQFQHIIYRDKFLETYLQNHHGQLSGKLNQHQSTDCKSPI